MFIFLDITVPGQKSWILFFLLCFFFFLLLLRLIMNLKLNLIYNNIAFWTS